MRRPCVNPINFIDLRGDIPRRFFVITTVALAMLEPEPDDSDGDNRPVIAEIVSRLLLIASRTYPKVSL